MDFPVPAGIPTHVTLPELRLLQRYAHEAGAVLEIGTYLGFSCIGMALAGAYVTSVDPHEHTWWDFLDYCQLNLFDRIATAADEDACLTGRHEHQGNIYAYRCTIESNPEFGELAPFGMAFIDGDHMWPGPMRDVLLALRYITAPCYLAMHDVTPNWAGVWRAHRMLSQSPEVREVARERFLRVYQIRASSELGSSLTATMRL